MILALACGMVGCVGLILPAQTQDGRPEPMTFSLECAGGDCPLLTGTPQTSGMRGGAVRLKPGESVGWHSATSTEESLVILCGNGTASIEGHADVPLHEKMLAYIAPNTKHNVTNTGADVLEYVWIVAPAR